MSHEISSTSPSVDISTLNVGFPPLDFSRKPSESPIYLPERKVGSLTKSTRPELAHPTSLNAKAPFDTGNFLMRIMDSADRIEKVHLTSLDKQMDFVQKCYNDTLDSHTLEEKKMQEALKDAEWWEFLTKVAFTLVGASSIVVGSTMISSGQSMLAGTSLILSGVGTIAGNCIIDMKKHPHAGLAVAIIGSGFGIAGCTMNFLWGNFSPKDIAMQVIATSLGVIANTASGLAEKHKCDISKLRGKYAISTGQLEELNHHMHNAETYFRNGCESAKEVHEKCQEAQRYHRQTIAKILSISGPLSAA